MKVILNDNPNNIIVDQVIIMSFVGGDNPKLVDVLDACSVCHHDINC